MSLISHFQSTIGAAGIAASPAEILDMGNDKYLSVPDEIRAAVYQIAIEQGWKESGILNVIKEIMGERYDQQMGESVISTMKELSEKHQGILTNA